MKKRKNLSAREYYLKMTIWTAIGTFILLIGILLDIEFIQWIGVICFCIMPYYFWLFLRKLREDEEAEESRK